MPEPKIAESLSVTLKIARLPAVCIVRGDKVLDIDGCLVKSTHNGRTQLRLKTFSNCIDCQSKAPYYGVLKWQSESCTPAREVKFRVKKRIIESDGETASYPVKLDKCLKNELMPEVSTQTSIFIPDDSLCVVTHDNEIIKATIDNIDHTAIQLKQSRLPNSLRRGCPIYDAGMRVIGLVKDKKLGVIWNASWIKQSNGKKDMLISRIARRSQVVQELLQQIKANSSSVALQNGHQTSLNPSLQGGEDYHFYDTPCDMESNTEPIDLNGSMKEAKILPSSDLEKKSQVKTIDSSSEYSYCYDHVELVNARISADLHVGKTTCDRESITEPTNLNGSMTEVNNILPSSEMNGAEDIYSSPVEIESKETKDDVETENLYCAKDEDEKCIESVFGKTVPAKAATEPPYVPPRIPRPIPWKNKARKELGIDEKAATEPPPVPPRIPIPVTWKRQTNKQGNKENAVASRIPTIPSLPPRKVQKNKKSNIDENMTYENNSKPLRKLDDSEVKKPTPQQSQPQNASSTQWHSMEDLYDTPGYYLHQNHHCHNSCVQDCGLPCRGQHNRCCLLDHKCQQQLGSQMPQVPLMPLHQCSYACHTSNLLATVSYLLNEQLMKCMANLNKESARDDGESSSKQTVPGSQYGYQSSDMYQPLIQSNVCGANEQTLENAGSRRDSRREDAGCNPAKTQRRSRRKSKKRRRKEKRQLKQPDEDSQPAPRNQTQCSKRGEDSLWNNIDTDITIGSLNYEARHKLAIEIDPKDWQRLARELDVPKEVIRDISFEGHFPSVDFSKELLTKYPDEKLIDFRQKVKEIERNDVVKFIDSSLKDFVWKRLEELPKDKLEELMKRLGEKATGLTKDWRNVAVKYDYEDEEIDYIASYVKNHTQESPTDCLVNYLAKSNPSLSIAKIGGALERLQLNRANLKLFNEYVT